MRIRRTTGDETTRNTTGMTMATRATATTDLVLRWFMAVWKSLAKDQTLTLNRLVLLVLTTTLQLTIITLFFIHHPRRLGQGLGRRVWGCCKKSQGTVVDLFSLFGTKLSRTVDQKPESPRATHTSFAQQCRSRIGPYFMQRLPLCDAHYRRSSPGPVRGENAPMKFLPVELGVEEGTKFVHAVCKANHILLVGSDGNVWRVGANG